MYKTKYCEVHYEKDYNVVFVKWKKFCCFENYRKPLEYALDIIKMYKNCNYVADTRDGFENHPDDTKWVADVFIPTAVEYGCKIIYFIIDENNSLKEELEGQESNSSDKIKFKYIYKLEDVKMKLKNIDNGNNFDFGKTSAEYAKYRDIYPKELYEKLYKLGVGHENTSWLDIGTGTGVLPFNLCNCGADITGIDISKSQIEVAKALAVEKGVRNANFLVSPAETTPFEDNSFDCITAAQCFWYFDRDKVIDEIKRLIKPGGVFLKIYMSYTLDDEIAEKSHELVKEMNKNWTPGASGSKDMYNHPFDNGKLDVFECKIPFTRESWHGRMLACRGTMASMDEKTLAEWNIKHNKLLAEFPETFEIKHKVYIASYCL